jgi:hypothetical protein
MNTNTREAVDAFLNMIDGAEAVAVTWDQGHELAVVSAWNGSATVNTAGVYLTTDGRLEVTGFDIWTSYELDGLAPREVVARMNDAAAEDLAADEEEAR